MKQGPLGRAMIASSLVASLLTACGGQMSEAELLRSANESVLKRDFPAATIQLKNVLQQNPASAEARFLMGMVLSADGNLAGADGELRRALSAGYSKDRIVPELARLMLMQGQEKKLITEFGDLRLEAPTARADLALSLASANAKMGDAAKAQQTLAESLAASPDFLPAKLFEIRMLAVAKGPEVALDRLLALGKLTEGSGEAAYLEGAFKLNSRQHDVTGAIDAYKRALTLKPDLVLPHMGLISIYLYQNDRSAAKQQVAAMKKALPKSVLVMTYEAQMALLDGDFKLARAVSQQTLVVAPRNVRALYIAGAAELSLRNYYQAVTYLNKALSIQPDLGEARKMLAKAYLQSGQPGQTLKALGQSLDGDVRDVEVLALAAEAQLQQGNVKASESLYKRALAIKPDDVNVRTALALSAISQGQEAMGVKSLELAANSDTGVVADMALISSYMSRGKLGQALASAEAMERKQADRPLAPYTRGRILLLMGDYKAARSALEKAVKMDKSYFPAVNSLAFLDVMEKQPDTARKRLEDVLRADPSNTGVMLSLADFHVTQGASKATVVPLIEAAVNSAPAEVAPRLMLIDYLLLQKENKAAVAAGQKAVAAITTSAELFDALGRAQLAVGDGAQALGNFNKLIQLQPHATKGYVMAAEAYRRLGDRDGAIRSFNSAVVIDPNLMAAHEGIVSLELNAGRFKQAIEAARVVQRQRPNSPLGYVWEGNVEAVQRHWEQAVAVYKSGIGKLQLIKADVGELPVRVHLTLLAAKREADADRFQTEWLRSNPHDLNLRAYLGDLAMSKQDWSMAEQRYREIISLDPNNAVAANNIAAMLTRQKKPGAVEMAERAVALAPKGAEAVDTLAAALAETGELPRAIETQIKAIQMAPDVNRFKLNLARLYLKSGDKAKAKVELEGLRSLGDKFPGQSEVSELLKTM